MTNIPDARAPRHDLESVQAPSPSRSARVPRRTHETDGYTILRTLRPNAVSVSAVIGGVDHPMDS